MYENENRIIEFGQLRVHPRHSGMPCKSKLEGTVVGGDGNGTINGGGGTPVDYD